VRRGRWIALLFFALTACGASPSPVRQTENADADADGVHDRDDGCPSDAEDADGRHDEDGCPDLDDDADEIADVNDLCPCDVEDRDGWEDADGCPDPDNDGDRIVDACDLCPDYPETYNGGCDEDGCPDHGHICIEESSIRILEYIFFRRGSATVQPQSLPILDAVADVMRGNPQITLVAIIGHADAHERQPEALARRRAEAVLEALVSRGAQRERFVVELGSAEAVASLPPEQQRRAGFSVRVIDGEALPIVAEGTPLPERQSGCGSHTADACRVPVCDPVVTPPAC
jgi:outer membrane protein OmpA-like peptidoglycan-associated protein